MREDLITAKKSVCLYEYTVLLRENIITIEQKLKRPIKIKDFVVKKSYEFGGGVGWIIEYYIPDR